MDQIQLICYIIFLLGFIKYFLKKTEAGNFRNYPNNKPNLYYTTDVYFDLIHLMHADDVDDF